VGAVALAVAISIIFVSFQNGFQDFLFNIIFRYLPHITVSPVEGKDYLHLYRGIIDTASSIPGVFAVSPTLATTVTLVHKNKAENVAMIGIDPLEGDKISDVSKSMIEGNLSSVLGGKRIVMGRPLADKLKRGDTVLAMGTTRWSIAKIFLAQSLILGPPAALLGSILAYLAAKAINAYPIQMPSSDFNTVFRMTVLLTSQTYILAVVFALAVNFLAGIYPAYKASKLDPVEAIGNE